MTQNDAKFTGDLLDERAAGSPSTTRQILFDLRVLRAGWGLILFSIVFIGCVLLESIFIERYRTRHSLQTWFLTPHDILNPLIAFTSVILATFIPSLFEQRRASSYGLRGFPWKNLAIGIVTAGGLVTATYIAMRFAHLVQPAGPRTPWITILKYAPVWIGIFAMFAVLEELLTRGYLQYTLTRGLAFLYRRFFGVSYGIAGAFWTSAIATSLLYVVLYRGNLGQTDAGLRAIFTLGMLYCWSLWRTGSLWWALGFHAAWDFVQAFVFMQWDGGLPIRDHLFTWVATGPVQFSGGHAGLNGSLLVYPLLLIAFLSTFLLKKDILYPELWELARAQARERDTTDTVPDPGRA